MAKTSYSYEKRQKELAKKKKKEEKRQRKQERESILERDNVNEVLPAQEDEQD